MSHTRHHMAPSRPSKIRKHHHPYALPLSALDTRAPLCVSDFTGAYAPPAAAMEGERFASPPAWYAMDDSGLDNQLYRNPAVLGDNSAWTTVAHLLDHPAPKPLPTNGNISLDYLCLDFNAAHRSASAPYRAMSTVSSTCSPGSTVSQLSSAAGTALSPVQTEHPSEWLTTASSVLSRGPSPLCQPPTAAEEKEMPYICLGPQCNSTFASDDELNSHIKREHTHTCSWAGCEQPSFSTRDGLISHVKVEHLLVCPAPGCTVSSFQTSRLLESHIRVVHPKYPDNEESQGKQASTSSQPAPQPMTNNPSSQGSSLPLAVARSELMEDRAIKEVLSVAVSKKRCREQLKRVVEKKHKRSIGTPRAADSPTDMVRSRTPRLIDTASFPVVWEHGVLPFLIEFVPKWCGPKHVISVTRGKAPGSRRICLMTTKKVSRARRMIIVTHIRDLLPEPHRPMTSFVFSTGQVDRLVWARGLGKQLPDEVCMPRNPYHYKGPCMGDSIGVAGNGKFKDSTSTLGPCIILGNNTFWLANFHPFIEASASLESVVIQHPSPPDRSRCLNDRHDALCEDDDFGLGSLTAQSGLDLKTTRITHDPYWEDCDKELPLVVTDWSLIDCGARQANILRRFPSETMPLLKETPVKSTAAITPGASVWSAGRTSGHQRGQISEIPAYVSGDENGTGRATREWFVEEPYPYDDEDAWIRGGIGVEGDSGAAIVDCDTNALVGQLWGRNKYYGPGPRLTYFTPISDIFDDIQEKCTEQGRPQLPQYRDEDDRYPVYPSCRQCYDLRTYLESRRSSRESLRSMIGRNESDPDLTSIEAQSELATPKDHSYLLRGTGMEDAGSSFHGMSPVANPFYFQLPGTPGITDHRSPYAMTLSAEDLYDPEYDPPADPATGKRAAPALQLVRSSSMNGKRPRIG